MSEAADTPLSTRKPRELRFDLERPESPESGLLVLCISWGSRVIHTDRYTLAEQPAERTLEGRVFRVCKVTHDGEPVEAKEPYYCNVGVSPAVCDCVGSFANTNRSQCRHVKAITHFIALGEL
jgi:hypothetical protein